jgi:uncharacterized membrane protein HdeD (DUF308 family)
VSAATSNEAAPASARTLGILLLLAGLVLLVWPAATTRVLASWVGVGAVAYGVRELTRTFAGDGDRIEFSAGLLGLISVFGGVVIAVTPSVSVAAASTVIGIYWLIAGLFEVAGAFLRPAARLERLLVGVISLATAGLVLALPSASLVVLVWLSGGWLLSAGAIMLLMDFMLTGGRRAVG